MTNRYSDFVLLKQPKLKKLNPSCYKNIHASILMIDTANFSRTISILYNTIFLH